MSDGRDPESRATILAAIQRNVRRSDGDRAAKARVLRRLKTHPRGPVPARTQGTQADRLDLFQARAEAAEATVRRLDTWDAVPAAVAAVLRARNEPAEVALAPHPDLTGLNWAIGAPLLGLRHGPPGPETAVGVGRAFAGVAETGSLLVRSGPDSPTTLNFLPAVHIVCLTAEDIVGPFEDAWDRLRTPDAPVPRSVTLITGPSRTADIEQTLQLGAHGPVALHILVVDPDDGGSG